MWVLHEKLEADSIAFGAFDLCDVRVMNAREFPWLILIPRRENIRELYELSAIDQTQLMREISLCSEAIQRVYHADKLNVAALGNQVEQLHIHVIARFKDDAMWPKPVWGSALTALSDLAREEVLLVLAKSFEKCTDWVLAGSVSELRSDLS